MNIDARVAELKYSDIPEKHITLLLNLLLNEAKVRYYINANQTTN